jgi:hypothetical protein
MDCPCQHDKLGFVEAGPDDVVGHHGELDSAAVLRSSVMGVA